jgi:hypothetical protein
MAIFTLLLFAADAVADAAAIIAFDACAAIISFIDADATIAAAATLIFFHFRRHFRFAAAADAYYAAIAGFR